MTLPIQQHNAAWPQTRRPQHRQPGRVRLPVTHPVGGTHSREALQPWHAVVLVTAGLALLIAIEITLAFGLAKLVTGHAY